MALLSRLLERARARRHALAVRLVAATPAPVVLALERAAHWLDDALDALGQFVTRRLAWIVLALVLTNGLALKGLIDGKARERHNRVLNVRQWCSFDERIVANEKAAAEPTLEQSEEQLARLQGFLAGDYLTAEERHFAVLYLRVIGNVERHAPQILKLAPYRLKAPDCAAIERRTVGSAK